MTSIDGLLFVTGRFRGRKKSRAGAQLGEGVDEAERREDGKRVFGPQHAAGVQRDQHHEPQLEAARQGVGDGKALQGERCAEPADADREILRRRRRAGRRRRPRSRTRRRRAATADEATSADPARVSCSRCESCGRARRGVEIDAEHQQGRGRDRGRTEADKRLGEDPRLIAVLARRKRRSPGRRAPSRPALLPRHSRRIGR